MKLTAIIAIIACKAAHRAARILHRGGTAMPGRVALKICPSLLCVLARNTETVVITGTNGKTTSSRMVEKAFEDAGLDPLANRSGANLISGITTEFALNSSIFGTCRKKYAVIECDEAAARLCLPMLKPKVVLVTNLFRDQLDRYGEVTHTLAKIREGLEGIPEAVLCLNADCSLTSSLALKLENDVVYYGINQSAAPEARSVTPSDATHCIRCKSLYSYAYSTYGHLGGFYCENCGYKRPEPDVAVTSINEMTGDASSVTMAIDGHESEVAINLPAIYNIYNAAGAIACIKAFGMDTSLAIKALAMFKCGFGRMEKFDLGKMGARMCLVKNPAGCNQVIDFLAATKGERTLVLCLNDNDADGTDVSWIWDVSFETLAENAESYGRIIVSGLRANDLRVRLKYAGFDDSKIELICDYNALAETLADEENPIYIVPTYTAMLDFRACLVAKLGGSGFWEG